MRSLAAVCLAASSVGPAVWLADALGFAITALSVRRGFVLTLPGLLVANVAALWHLLVVSRLPRAQKLAWVQSLFMGFRLFASFEYLIGGGVQSKKDGRRRR